MHKFWTENVFWWNFWSKIKKNWYQKALNIVFGGGQKCSKTIVTFEISTREFVKNEFITHTGKFGIRPAFFEGLGPGPGRIYRVDQLRNICI